MDLSLIKITEQSDAGADMELTHPVTGEVLTQDDGSPITIHLCGIDSAAYRKKQRENQSRRLTQIAKGKKID